MGNMPLTSTTVDAGARRGRTACARGCTVEVVQVLEVLHQLEHVGHLAPAASMVWRMEVERVPALREDGALLDVAAELARAANQRGGLIRDVVVAAHNAAGGRVTAMIPLR